MCQILATSALNLAVTHAEKRVAYHQHAVQLQSEALSTFTTTLESINESNVVAAFLVSSLVGMYSFAETFFFRANDFNSTLDSLLRSFELLRGCRVIIGPWWEFLLSTELQPILFRAHEQRFASVCDNDHLRDLGTLIDDADISTPSKKVYETAIEELVSDDYCDV